MSRLVLSLLEALGLAFCEKGRKALKGYAAFGDALGAVAEHTLKELRKHMPADQIRVALAETAALPRAEYAAILDHMIKGLCRVQSIPFKNELHDYLTHLPLMIQQMFHRPSDPDGHRAPKRLDFYKPEQLLPFLPPRRPHFQAGARPEGLDHWDLDDLLGLGECGEVWLGHDDDQPHPAALKFVIDVESKKRFRANTSLFQSVFALNEINGVVPLRTVYLECDPPCLEYAFVSGYDVTGLMHEWSWKYHAPQPAAALKLIQRITSVVAEAHRRGVVHRDLKPSNLLVHPTEGGRMTLWITDFGWGQLEAVRSLELHRTGGTPVPEQKRLALRGAYTPLYASPQQTQDGPPTPHDDVHALGVIWYQLLKCDPHATAPIGDDWADEFLPHGLSKHHAKLLSACVAIRPEKRPPDAGALLEQLNAESESSPLADPSKVIALKAGSSTQHKALAATAVKTVPVKAAIGTAAHVAGTLLGTSAYHPVTPVRGTAKLLRNSLGISFVPIPAGTFEMGADHDEPGRKPDETPRHTVRIAQSFYLSTTPITQSQYEKLMARNPSFFRSGGATDFPVESISWLDADRFCKRLTRYGDEETYGRVYRLPTEAEWEYACRAGSRTPFHYGETLHGTDAHYAALALKGQGHPCGVAQHAPNAWGLCDMHGNVDEWVGDWYAADYYIDSSGSDPRGPLRGEHRVIRGGDWAGHDVDCRSASRRHQHPDRPLNTLGFRIVMLTPGR